MLWKNVFSAFALMLLTSTSGVAQTSLMAEPSFPLLDTQLRKMPDGIPPALFNKMLSGDKFVGSQGLAWSKQKVITVAFQGGTDDLYALIEQTANKWISIGGQLKFSFQDKPGHYRRWTAADKTPAANIRIAFNNGVNDGGYWSLLGLLAKNVGPDEPTMNFEGFPEKLQRYFRGQNAAEWVKSYEHSTILHEFGHALGLAHEHFHPQCQKDLKMKAIIAYLMGPPNNWSEEQARFNMDSEYYKDMLGRQAASLDSKLKTSRTIDQASVMLYLFPEGYYVSGNKSVCKPTGDSGKSYPTSLSDGDKEFYLTNYKTILSPFGGN